MFLSIRKRIAELFLFLVLWQARALAYEIHGLVQDGKSLNPLKGANVTLLHTSLGNTTDAEGRFIIVGVAQGRHDLSVSLLGYQSKTIKVTVGGGPCRPVAPPPVSLPPWRVVSVQQFV